MEIWEQCWMMRYIVTHGGLESRHCPCVLSLGDNEGPGCISTIQAMSGSGQNVHRAGRATGHHSRTPRAGPPPPLPRLHRPDPLHCTRPTDRVTVCKDDKISFKWVSLVPIQCFENILTAVCGNVPFIHNFFHVYNCTEQKDLVPTLLALYLFLFI